MLTIHVRPSSPHSVQYPPHVFHAIDIYIITSSLCPCALMCSVFELTVRGSVQISILNVTLLIWPLTWCGGKVPPSRSCSSGHPLSNNALHDRVHVVSI